MNPLPANYGPMLRKVKAVFITALLAAIAAFGTSIAGADGLNDIGVYGLPIGAAIAGVVSYAVRESRTALQGYIASESEWGAVVEGPAEIDEPPARSTDAAA